ncbi:MAG: hypothetical protein ACM3WU_09265 [Bacillota bacterium]
MLQEVAALLSRCQPDASHGEYIAAIVDDNCLGKKTAATRRLSAQRLSELYGLDRKILLFRVFRRLWDAAKSDQGLLALLLALARDPLLRATAEPVLRMSPGQELARHEMAEAVRVAVGDRLNDSTLDKVLRNAASSWTQSGHLRGYSHKLRQVVSPTPVSTAYALLLGFLCGFRGQALFETFWARVLDCTSSEMLDLAVDARRLGFLDVTYGGGVVQVSLAPLLT